MLLFPLVGLIDRFDCTYIDISRQNNNRFFSNIEHYLLMCWINSTITTHSILMIVLLKGDNHNQFFKIWVPFNTIRACMYLLMSELIIGKYLRTWHIEHKHSAKTWKIFENLTYWTQTFCQNTVLSVFRFLEFRKNSNFEFWKFDVVLSILWQY